MEGQAPLGLAGCDLPRAGDACVRSPVPKLVGVGSLESGAIHPLAREPADADLGDEDRGQHRAHPWDLLDHRITPVIPEPLCDLTIDQADLAVLDLEPVPDRFDPDGVGVGEGSGVQQLCAGFAEPIGHRNRYALFGEYGVDLAAQTRAQLAQLDAVTDQLAQLAEFRRRDPRLGQPSQTEQVREILSVAFVVLDPALAPGVAQRMSQMQQAAQLCDHIRGPVPAVASLHHDFSVRHDLAERRGQRQGLVADAPTIQDPAVTVLADDHAARAMQVDYFQSGQPSDWVEYRRRQNRESGHLFS